MNQGMAGQYRRTAIAGAVAVCAMTSGQGWAQEQAGAAPAPGLLDAQTVVVTGVRAALEQSLRQKRNADAVVEVVTAEDIGKMPDKNVADAIQRLPGVNLTGYRTFRDARFVGSFEGDTQIGLGVRARLPFRVWVTDGRIVVDVAHNWTGAR